MIIVALCAIFLFVGSFIGLYFRESHSKTPLEVWQCKYCDQLNKQIAPFGNFFCQNCYFERENDEPIFTVEEPVYCQQLQIGVAAFKRNLAMTKEKQPDEKYIAQSYQDRMNEEQRKKIDKLLNPNKEDEQCI